MEARAGHCPSGQWSRRRGRGSYVSYVPFGLYLYFCPLREASYINPPFATVNTAIPLRYLPRVSASFLPPLAPADEPVVPVEPDTPAVMATALTPAPNSKFPLVNSSKARLSWKKTIWLYS